MISEWFLGIFSFKDCCEINTSHSPYRSLTPSRSGHVSKFQQFRVHKMQKGEVGGMAGLGKHGTGWMNRQTKPKTRVKEIFPEATSRLWGPRVLPTPISKRVALRSPDSLSGWDQGMPSRQSPETERLLGKWRKDPTEIVGLDVRFYLHLLLGRMPCYMIKEVPPALKFENNFVCIISVTVHQQPPWLKNLLLSSRQCWLFRAIPL